MAKVTEQTVEIKKSPRSTFGLSSSKSGSARIGDLNMVFHKMLEPSDMIRCQVDTQIIFISPLQVPAFAKMKVFTYYFFDSYQNVYSDFNDTIQNYTHQVKQELNAGTIVSKNNYQLPYINLGFLSEYICTGLHWAPPINPTSTTIPVAPFGDPNSYDTGEYGYLFNFPMQRDFCFSTYEQKIDIAKLCNQFDIPYGCLMPISKEFQKNLSTFTNFRPSVNNVSGFSWSDDANFADNILNLPFTKFWSTPVNFAGDSKPMINTVSASGLKINLLPFKIYQHIFNDWFLNTQKNTEIDIFKDVVYFTPTAANFIRSSSFTHDNLNYTDFRVQLYPMNDNYYMNSLLAIRRPWFAKDYFNVSTNDPTLGVSPYAVGTSILDLRKNSALQRLAEKKALCGNKFVDFIAQHFNYYPPELDISRSIHLGTSVAYVNINQVLQTSQTTETSPQGERAATAQSYGRSKGVFFKAPTYGEFMVLQCVKPEIDYYDGIPREMLTVDVADIPLPELSQIGFDSIYNAELFVNPLEDNYNLDLMRFGYAPRYSWRKTQQNRIYGELCYTLNYWHQSPSLRFGVNNDWQFGQIGFDTQNIANTPYRETSVLNPSFNRIFAITDLNEDTYVYQHAISCTLNTCLPTNDSPQL